MGVSSLLHGLSYLEHTYLVLKLSESILIQRAAKAAARSTEGLDEHVEEETICPPPRLTGKVLPHPSSASHCPALDQDPGHTPFQVNLPLFQHSPLYQEVFLDLLPLRHPSPVPELGALFLLPPYLSLTGGVA